MRRQISSGVMNSDEVMRLRRPGGQRGYKLVITNYNAAHASCTGIYTVPEHLLGVRPDGSDGVGVQSSDRVIRVDNVVMY